MEHHRQILAGHTDRYRCIQSVRCSGNPFIGSHHDCYRYLFLLETTGFEFFGLDAWDIVLPVVIIIIGIWMLFPSSGNQVVSKDFVKQAAIFSGAEIACDSKEFKGADLFAMFGGISLDLREAEIGEERPVKMDVFAAFGGVDIIVPEGTKVRITGIPLFGGWSNKTVKVTQTAEADMTVNVFVMFGGMDVKNHK